jgi:hypothetical protein
MDVRRMCDVTSEWRAAHSRIHCMRTTAPADHPNNQPTNQAAQHTATHLARLRELLVARQAAAARRQQNVHAARACVVWYTHTQPHTRVCVWGAAG